MLGLVSRGRDKLFLLRPSELVPSENGERIESPKRCVLNKGTTDNVQNCNNYINIPLTKPINLSHKLRVANPILSCISNIKFPVHTGRKCAQR
jgi:hypothetical protein